MKCIPYTAYIHKPTLHRKFHHFHFAHTQQMAQNLIPRQKQLHSWYTDCTEHTSWAANEREGVLCWIHGYHVRIWVMISGKPQLVMSYNANSEAAVKVVGLLTIYQGPLCHVYSLFIRKVSTMWQNLRNYNTANHEIWCKVCLQT